MRNFFKNPFKSSAIALGFLLIGFSLTSCGGGGTGEGGTSTDNLIMRESVAYNLVPAQAPEGGYKIYLDASGSMPGYFTDGLTQYISIVSALQGANDNSKVHFWGEPNREVKDVNSDITKHNYKAKSSLFQDIFKTMAEDVANEDVLSFIITDGIVSNSSKVTNQRTGYTKSDLPLIPNKIKDSLKNDSVDLGVALFRFNVPFSGKYWNIDNKPVDLKNVERPLYVFAIGKPGAIVDFKENVINSKEMEDFKNLDPVALYLGMLEKVKDKNLFEDGSDNGLGFSIDENEDGFESATLSQGNSEFALYSYIPKWIIEDGINVKNIGKLNFASTDGVENEDLKAKVKDTKLTVETKEDAIIDPGNYTITYSIEYRPAEAWKEYSCDDDRTIKEDETLMDKTFGLAEIIKGFELATKHPDKIYETTFRFTQE